MLPLPSSDQCHFTVAFSPGGRWLAAGGSAHRPDVWDLHAPHEPARRLESLSYPVVRVHVTPDDWLVAVASDQVRITNLTTANPVSGQGLRGFVNRAAVSPGAELLVATGNGLRGWSPLDLPARLRWSRDDDTCNGIADLALPNDELLVTVGTSPLASVRGFVQVRLAASGHIRDTFRVPGSPHRVACSADGELAAVITNGHLSVWHLPTRSAVVERTGEGHGGCLSVAFDPHGRRVVTGGIDSTVGVWEATGGPPVKTFQWGVGPVYAVAFDRDGLRAAAAGHSGAIVWDVDE